MEKSFDEHFRYWVDSGFPSDMLKIAALAQLFKHKRTGNGVADLAKGNEEIANTNFEVAETRIFEFQWYFSGTPSKEERSELINTLLQQFNLKYTRDQNTDNRQDIICAWCKLLFGSEGVLETTTFHKDHILPLMFFAVFDENWNIQWLCDTHNSIKGSFPIPIQDKHTPPEWNQIIIDQIKKLML